MAHPSSSHRERDDDRGTTRERTHRTSSAHHHHRTISSTTLLLVLSLILAVLAVMLSLPSRSSTAVPTTASASRSTPQDTTAGAAQDADGHSFWGYLTPKRSHALVSRESNVAYREAEVARREAELLVGRPGGWTSTCPVCGETVVEEFTEGSPSISLVSRPIPPQPTVTVYQEVVKEIEPSNPAWLQSRMDGLVDRETRISDREKEVGVREENVGKREADAAKREGWILENLPGEEEIYDRDHPRHYYAESRRAPPKVGTNTRN